MLLLGTHILFKSYILNFSGFFFFLVDFFVQRWKKDINQNSNRVVLACL